LAYPVRHRNEGYYVVIQAQAEPAALSELDRSLTLTDEVIRHKAMRLPNVPLAARARGHPTNPPLQ